MADPSQRLDGLVKKSPPGFATSLASLHPLRSGEPACRGQRSGPRSWLHGAADGALLPAAHQSRQPERVHPSQRPLHLSHECRWSQQTGVAPIWWNERKPDQPPLWESSLCATLFIWGMDWGAVTLRVWPTALRPARAENTTCVYHGAHPCGQEWKPRIIKEYEWQTPTTTAR